MMNTTKLDQALILARTAARKAGAILLPYYGNIASERKNSTDPSATNVVTLLDRKIEKFLASELSVFDSKIAFFGEELGKIKTATTTWLVDPIDGTSHFVRGLPFCTIMIALVQDGQVVLSVIHDIVQNDTYWAIRNKGAYKNSERINVSSRPLHSSFLSFDSRLRTVDDEATYIRLQKETRGLIQTINSGFEYAMVASGKLDGRITKDPYGEVWDYAPGSLLVQEAGGIVTNIGETTLDYNNTTFLAVNPVIFKELTQGDEAIFPIK